MADGKKRLMQIGLAAVAVLATFGIGLIVGREITRPAATAEAPAPDSLSAFSKVPAELLLYRLRLKVPVPLDQPRGFAVRQDGTLVACGDKAVVVLGRTGALKARFDLEEEPVCVALGGEKMIYLGLRDHVAALDAATGAATAWPDLGSQAIVTSIAVSGSSVFVTDAGNHMLLRFDTHGKLSGIVDSSFRVPSPFFDASSSADGSLWVANPGAQRVQHYGADGRLIGSWGRASADVDGFLGCCNPAHIAVLPCGSVVTSEKGVPRVKVYEPDGRLSAVVALPADFPAGTVSLPVATRKANGGEVLILVPGERAVRVYCHKEMAGDD
ncbi:MAG: hypothetical protein ABSF77_04870 [Spirochaetia bacterium]|jgi:hypothetical protein